MTVSNRATSRAPVRVPRKLILSLGLPCSRHGRAKGEWAWPFPHGKGLGMVVFFAAEAVSRFPGPPLEDPPQVPPQFDGGAWGNAVGRPAHGLPRPHGRRRRRGRCARLAWRSGCSETDRTFTSSSGSAADVPPSAANGAAVEPLRALLHSVFSGPAPGLAGDRGGGRDVSTERSDLRCGPIAKRASVMRSMTDEKPTSPGHGERTAA